MKGKTVVLTGASSGIGAAAARELAALGATVIAVGRSPERTAAIAAELGTAPVVADFARLDDVRTAATAILAAAPRIDVLAHNAGGLISHRTTTVDGHEATFQTNHLAPFLLQHLLADRLAASAANGPARVIATSSVGHRFARLRLDDLDWQRRRYRSLAAYGTAKLANILFARALATAGVDAYSFHPGNVATAFAADNWFPVGWIYRTPLRSRLLIPTEAGAAPLVWLASAPTLPAPAGTYFDRFEVGRVRAGDLDRLAAGLWERSAELVGG